MDILDLKRHIATQLKNIMCFEIDLTPYIDEAVKRANVAFSASNNKYYTNVMGGGINPYHSGQYAIFLYILSNVMYKKDGDAHNAEKVYYMNKVLNCIDILYSVELPDIWGVEHPLGSVMGRAKYGNRFFFYQGCTIGGNKKDYPVLGNDVTMYSNSKVLGKCNIGNNVILSANSYVIDYDIPDDCIVFPAPDGDGRHPKIVHRSHEEMVERAKQIWKF